MIYRLLLACLVCSLNLATANTRSSTTPMWSDILQKTSAKDTSNLGLMPDSYRMMKLDEEKMRITLQSIIEGRSGKKPVQLSIPLPDGQSIDLTLSEENVMARALAEKYPLIKTFRIDSQVNKGIYGAVDMTEEGFHAMVYLQDGTRLFIDPRPLDNSTFYISYYDKDYHPAEKKAFSCNIHNPGNLNIDSTFARDAVFKTASRTGTSLRTYRLAMAATGEYTSFHGGTVAGSLSAITTTINRVNTIYRRDLAIKLELVANNDALIFTNAATDPYSTNPESMLIENRIEINKTIGESNYDIGHVVSTVGGGLAQIEAVCSAGKAEGLTGSSSPQGDSFDIDFVAHEIGHQFGATHTFNSTTESCGGGNRTAATAFEPGSGSSIMAYAGICGVNNVQNNSDAMFHVASIVQISNFVDDITGGGACGTVSSLNNTTPVANAGLDYTIPANTPFELAGSGTDPDQDTLSYSWEQIDAGTASDIGQVTTDNAIFRSYLPTSLPVRTFPSLNAILTNTASKGETLPDIARVMNFSLAVRDGKGGVAADETVINVSSSAAFKVTSHTTPQTLLGDTNTLVTWDVASTRSLPINCSAVDILLSTDGGASFINISGGSTTNDGSESVKIPGNVSSSTQARLKVKCADNIFFSISDVDLTTQALLSALPAVIKNTGSNNVADPGETVVLTLPLKNNSTTLMTSVTGVLTSSDTDTKINVANSSYPDLQPGSEGSNTTDYRVNIPVNQVCGVSVPVQLDTQFTLNSTFAKVFDYSIPVGSALTGKETNSTLQVIPDNSSAGIISQITVSGIGVSAKPDINIDINISHPYRSDLIVELISPQGTTVRLFDRTGSSANDLMGNYPGTLIPTEDLSAFNGENLDGIWTLKVVDTADEDTGTLNSWTLNFTHFNCEIAEPQNIAPVSFNQAISTNQDDSIAGILEATDENSDALSYILVSQATKGNVQITNTATGAFTYTPLSGQTGQDNFTFKVNDGTDDSNVSTVTVTINTVEPVNEAPVANNSTAATEENTVLVGTLSATDADNDTLAYRIVTNATKGNVVIVNSRTGAYRYTPASGQTGRDQFTFKANDGSVDSNIATITININPVVIPVPVNKDPVATNSSETTVENGVLTGTLQASDGDNNPLTYSIVTNATKGTVVIIDANNGTYSYTPLSGQTGQDSFTFKVSDGAGGTSTATVTIMISEQVVDTPSAPLVNNLSNNPSTGEASAGGGGSFSWFVFPLLLLLSLYKRSSCKL